MAKSSIHFRAVKPTSEAHNLRQVDLDYNYPDLKENNISWVSESIDDRITKIKRHCKMVSGRKLQKNAQPVKEAVVNIKPETTIEDLKHLGESLKDRFGMECFQIHIHRDEGHVSDSGEIVINQHAHMLFDWQNKTKGTTLKLNRLHLSQIQTLVSESLQMERGELRVNSNRERLEPIEYKREQAQLQFERLQEQNEILEQKKNRVRERIAALESEGEGFDREGQKEAIRAILSNSQYDQKEKERKLLKIDENSLSEFLDEAVREGSELEQSIELLNRKISGT